MENPILDIDSPLSLIMKDVDPVNWKYLTTHSITKRGDELKISSQEIDSLLYCKKGNFLILKRTMLLYMIFSNILRAIIKNEYSIFEVYKECQNQKLIVL